MFYNRSLAAWLSGSMDNSEAIFKAFVGSSHGGKAKTLLKSLRYSQINFW